MKLSHIRGIDSIRAVGVVLVIIYHLFTNILPGGFFGVDVFFVISGFLVTALLIKEHNEGKELDIIKFYVRRVKRLLPAAAFMVVCTLALSLLISPDLRVGMREQTAAVFGWVTNYFEIAVGGSYEDQLVPHLFVHTWTLGVEMHYYIIWGAVLGLVCHLHARASKKAENMNDFVYGMNRSVASEKLALFLLCAGIAVFAYMRMQLRLPALDDPSPVYYATSTRIYPLMIGSALGLFTGMRVPKKRLPAGLALPLVILIMATIVWMARNFTFSGAETYRYGILLASLLTVAAIFCLLSLQPKKFLKDIPPLAAIGKRSYSIYLFHWPLYNIFKQFGITGTGPFPENTPQPVYAFLAIAATIGLAEISYRMFEKRPAPAQAAKKATAAAEEAAARAAADVAARTLTTREIAPAAPSARETAKAEAAARAAALAARDAAHSEAPAAKAAPAEAPELSGDEIEAMETEAKMKKRRGRAIGAMAAVFCACALISSYTLVSTPLQTSIEKDYLHQQVLVNIYQMSQYNDYLSALQMDPVAMHGKAKKLPPKPSEMDAASDLDSDSQQTQENAEHALNRDDPEGPVTPILPPGGVNVTVIGDSVTLGAADIIQQTIGSVIVDAEVSRNMGAGARIINEYVERGELGEYVVIALFTNVQSFTEPATNETMAAIPPGHRVIAVTPFGKDYMEETAEMVRRLPYWYDYITVADWNAAIRDHTDLLAPDRLHMHGDDSKQIYANLIAQAIEQASKKPAKQ